MAATDIIPAISDKPFIATPTGLILDRGSEVSYEIWEAYGSGLARVEASIQWVIGDWLNFGAWAFGEKYSQAIDERQADTWRIYAWVAANVPMNIRNPNLSWSHHRAVAHLPEDEQAALLYMAEDGEMSTRELQMFVRGQDPNQPFDADAWRALWKRAAKKWFRIARELIEKG